MRKTARELEIRQDEFDDLVWVRDALDPNKPEVELPKWLEFDMSQWLKRKTDRQHFSCGTAACIGGTMSLLRMARVCSKDVDSLTREDFKRETEDYVDSAALDPLFFEYDVDLAMSREAAVAAIDAFLAGSKQPWYEVSA